MRDFKLAFRSFGKEPIFTLAAVLTLALGIGANTVAFSVFNAVILQPLPFRDPTNLVLVWQKRPDGQPAGVTPVNYQQWTKQSTSFEQLVGMYQQFYNFRSGQQSAQVIGAQVSPDFFRVLGIQPVLGRGFDGGDGRADAPKVALLSQEFWQNQLGGDREMVGRTANINGELYTVVGILPPQVNSTVVFRHVLVWTAGEFDAKFQTRRNAMLVVGRLKPGVGIARADGEMQVIAKRLESEFPDANKSWSAMVTSLHDYGLSDVRLALMGLLGAVGFVLLIACVNVANLLLARAEIRQKEVAIRSALGASRTRLLGELCAENLVLALAGSLAGVALAHGALRLLIVLDAGQLPRVQEAGLDARVLGFTLAITVFTALLFGLFPARHLLGCDLNRLIRQTGRGSVHARMAQRSRSLLVVLQMALSLVLVAGAGLMIRNLLRLETESRGFLSEQLLSFRVSFADSESSDQRQTAASYARMLERIKAMPGVKAVATATNLPLDGYVMIGAFFRIPGGAPASSSERPIAACNLINPGYFKSIGTPILEGREFDERDREGAPPVAVISATLAKRFFPNENPIGRKIIVPTPGRAAIEVTREIVGVAGDIHYLSRIAQDSSEIYLPYLQTVWPVSYIMVRTGGNPKMLAPEVRPALREAGFDQPIAELQSMDDRIADVNGKPRLNSALAVIFAGIALVLAAVGIYGVISYSVAQSTKEIGLRMALGATPGVVVNWIMRRALLMATAGVMLGLAGHFAVSRVLGSLLYGISPNDAAALATATLVLSLTAMLASYIPARRAVRIDPMAALRAE